MPIHHRERLAQSGRALERVGGAREHPDRRVALPLCLEEAAPVRLGAPRDQLVVKRERRRHGIRVRPPTAPTTARCRSSGTSRRRSGARHPQPSARAVVLGLHRASGMASVARSMAASSSRSRSPGSMPELLDQRPARVLVGLERVRLAVGAVQREHQLRAQPLAGTDARRPAAPARPITSACRPSASLASIELLDRRPRADPRAALSRPGRTARTRGRRAARRATAPARARAPRARRPAARRRALPCPSSSSRSNRYASTCSRSTTARSRGHGSRARPPAAPCAAWTRSPGAS